MATSCSLLIAEGVVESVFAGSVSPDELGSTIGSTIELVRSSGIHRVLGDVRDLDGGHSVADLFGMVLHLERLGLPADYREALLVRGGPLGQSPEIRFWEDACRNRGIQVRMFTDRDEALAWLRAAAG